MTANPPGPGSTPPLRHQRRYPRCVVDMRVLVQVFRSGNFESIWGRSHEIGEDGISATLTGRLESGEVVSMEFTLPVATETVKLRAAVRYHSGFRYGFEFLTLSDAQRETIHRALQVLPDQP